MKHRFALNDSRPLSSTLWFPGIVALTLLLYSFSQLNFFPVPWPDASAFYLPSLDLFKWPPEWKMHSQAAFVESYDTANFNMMPLLPFILGLLIKLPFFSTLPLSQGIKIINLLSLGAWSLLLWGWTMGRARSKLPFVFVLFCALWDPSIRWGTLVVRSEPWIGLLWLGVLMILERIQNGESPGNSDGSRNPKQLWTLSLLLALGAYTHFEAIVLVPATVVGLYSKNLKLWATRLFTVGWQTTLLLLPWGIYIFSHFDLFLDQMATQFGRLSHSNFWVSSPYLAFHSLFMELGSPIGPPKFFNIAKGLFWMMALLGSLRILFLRRVSPKPHEVAAFVFFWTCFYLWCTKPEMWFTTLVHMALWPWVALLLRETLSSEKSPFASLLRNQLGNQLGNPLAVSLVLCSFLFGALSFFAQAKMLQGVSSTYNWVTYQKWIDCIEITVKEKLPEGRTPKLWQPHVPDALVELSRRQPSWDLTRTLDFENLRELAVRKIPTFDAILLTRAFDPPKNLPNDPYHGVERPSDSQLLSNEMDQPFGALLLSEYSSATHPIFDRKVCHYGPFFAMVLRKN